MKPSSTQAQNPNRPERMRPSIVMAIALAGLVYYMSIYEQQRPGPVGYTALGASISVFVAYMFFWAGVFWERYTAAVDGKP